MPYLRFCACHQLWGQPVEALLTVPFRGTKGKIRREPKSKIRTGTLSEREEFVPDAPLVALEYCHGSFQPEAGFAGVAGIEEQGTLNRFAKGLVRVAENNHLRALALEALLQGLREATRVDDVV